MSRAAGRMTRCAAAHRPECCADDAAKAVLETRCFDGLSAGGGPLACQGSCRSKLRPQGLDEIVDGVGVGRQHLELSRRHHTVDKCRIEGLLLRQWARVNKQGLSPWPSA